MMAAALLRTGLLLLLFLGPASTARLRPVRGGGGGGAPVEEDGSATGGSRIKRQAPRAAPGYKGAAGSIRRRPDPPGGDRDDGRLRNLVAGGTPTGGGKYPFLALVDYTNSSDEEGGDSFHLEPYCHGVMVAKDVLLRPAWCGGMEGGPLIVGDYNEASIFPLVQLIELSSERQVLTSPDGMISLEKVDPVTFLGFAPVPIVSDTSEPRTGRNVTVVGYGSNSSWDLWYSDTYEYPGVAIEAPLQVLGSEYCEQAYVDSGINVATVFCALGSNRAAGPCNGDYGAPILDDEGALVGLVEEIKCDNQVIPSRFIRIPYYSSWIIESICALTSDDVFLLCPKLLCPPEERVLGYPLAEVPDAAARIKTHDGFKPVKVSQTPPAGSQISGSTQVLVVASDQSGQTESCDWMLTVPMIDLVEEVDADVNSGTYDREIILWDEESGYYLSLGLVVMLTARLEHRLDGNSTVAKPFMNNSSNLNLHARDAATAANYVVIKLYGQVA